MSVRRDGTAIKRERLQKIHGMIRGAGDIPLRRFLAACSYTIGLNENTTMRYLQNLVELELIEIDEAANVVREVVKT